jgi:hypothetical protein
MYVNIHKSNLVHYVHVPNEHEGGDATQKFLRMCLHE